MTGVSFESHSRLMRFQYTIGKGDAHAYEQFIHLREPLRAGAPKASFPSGSAPPSSFQLLLTK